MKRRSLQACFAKSTQVIKTTHLTQESPTTHSPKSPQTKKNCPHLLVLHSFPPMSCVVTLPGLYRIASPEVNIATFNERRIGSEGFWWMVCTLVLSRVEMTDSLTGKNLLSKKFPMERLIKEIDVFVCVYIFFQHFVASEKESCHEPMSVRECQPRICFTPI